MASTSTDRILSLDVIRGIAVMGIFSTNVVGMGLIEQAYAYPPAFGFGGFGDKIMWAANFILVDGKFRGLFSILFGASMVLVIERGIAAGKRDWHVHFPRMIVLLLFGLVHFYALWWGDILANYALVGMIAFGFWRLQPRHLLLASAVAFVAMYGPMLVLGGPQIARYEAKAAPSATPAQHAFIQKQVESLHPTAADIADEKAQHASVPAHLRAMLAEEPLRPFESVPSYGLETLGLMLLGMAGYKSGFLTGSWAHRRYARTAAILIGVSVVGYGFAAWRIFKTDFAPFSYFPWDEIYIAWLRPFAACGYAALIMLLFAQRNGVTKRLAAVGRTAFTNYLGATLVGTMLFFGTGFDLFGEVSRGQAWLFVPFVWAAMLLWSKPWLDRYHYGPFEWLWRSLSRWRWEPMRRSSSGATPEPA
ncbi:MAG: DUF418 domain-containing protein [Croceibacterium sp.]